MTASTAAFPFLAAVDASLPNETLRAALADLSGLLHLLPDAEAMCIAGLVLDGLRYQLQIVEQAPVKRRPYHPPRALREAP